MTNESTQKKLSPLQRLVMQVNKSTEENKIKQEEKKKLKALQRQRALAELAERD